MASAAAAGWLPWYVPELVATLFAQYAIDSVLRRGQPIASKLGHLCGIANYALVLTLAAEPIIRETRLIIDYGAPLMAVFYLAAMGERIRGYLR